MTKGTGSGVELSLYGGLCVRCDGCELDVGGPQPRSVLAVLALAAPNPVDVGALADAVWGDDLPTDPRRDLHTMLSRLRSVLGPATIRTERPASYRLAIGRDAIDAGRLERALEDTRRATDAAALDRLQQAVAATSGVPLGRVVRTPAIDAASRSLERLREAAEDRLAVLLLDDGRAGDAVALLERLVARAPLHEGRWALLVRALAAAGRRGDALRCYQRAREVLVDTLGIEPGPGLRAAEAEVLAADRAALPVGGSRPETRFVDVGGASVAYQVWGDGPIDLVLVPNLVSHLEAMHDLPGYREWLEGLAAFSRLVVFDKLGNGASDRLLRSMSLAERIVDIGAVMDAVGVDRAVLVGCSEGGALSLLFAACHPGRVACVVTGGSIPAGRVAAGVATEAEHGAMLARLRETWGTERDWWIYDLACPSMRDAPAWVRASYERFSRMSSTPASAALLWDLYGHMDVRPVLGSVQCPVLVQYRAGESTRWGEADLVGGLPHAELSIVPGDDHAQWCGDLASYVAPIRSFVQRHAVTAPSHPCQRLATVVVADTAADVAHVDTAYVERMTGVRVVRRERLLLATFATPMDGLDAAVALARYLPGAGIAVDTGDLAIDDGPPRGPVVDVAVEAAVRTTAAVVVGEATRLLTLGGPHRFEPVGAGVWRYTGRGS